MPRPYSSVPALLLIAVRFFVPRAWSALIRFSGMPHRPKPPNITVAPSGIIAAASSALANTLSITLDYMPRATIRLFEEVPHDAPPGDRCRPVYAARDSACHRVEHAPAD